MIHRARARTRGCASGEHLDLSLSKKRRCERLSLSFPRSSRFTMQMPERVLTVPLFTIPRSRYLPRRARRFLWGKLYHDNYATGSTRRVVQPAPTKPRGQAERDVYVCLRSDLPDKTISSPMKFSVDSVRPGLDPRSQTPLRKYCKRKVSSQKRGLGVITPPRVRSCPKSCSRCSVENFNERSVEGRVLLT